MPILLLLIALPGLIVFIDFICFLIKGKQVVNEMILGVAEVGSLLILPFMYANFGKDNRCCVDEIDTAAFSPQHQLTILTLIILSLASYAYSKFRTEMATPLIEVLANSCILIGIILNIFIAFHTTESIYAIFGNLPIILLGILMLANNQKTLFEKLCRKQQRKLKQA